MLSDPAPKPATMPRGFIAVHRLVGEIAAGRPVLLHDGPNRLMASPLDGGPVLSERLALSASRAVYLGLGDRPVVVSLRQANPAQMWQLATAQRQDLASPGKAAEGSASLPFGARVEPAAPIAAAACELGKLAERLPAMTLCDGSAGAGDLLSAHAADVLAFRRILAGTARPLAAARVPLASGAMSTVTAFRDAVGGVVSAVSVGEPRDGALVRVHSSCITGDVFGSLKCDCGAQLHLALERISAEGGTLVYTAQEGRGIGLVNKLRAYSLQEHGLDTVDANIALGYHDDERDYTVAASVLRRLGLRRVRLLTNNPGKAAGLAIGGLVVDPVALRSEATAYNADYLATKRQRSGHTL